MLEFSVPRCLVARVIIGFANFPEISFFHFYLSCICTLWGTCIYFYIQPFYSLVSYLLIRCDAWFDWFGCYLFSADVLGSSHPDVDFRASVSGSQLTVM